MLKKLSFSILSALFLLSGSINALTICEELGSILDGDASIQDNACSIFIPRNDLSPAIGSFTLQPEIGIGMELDIIPSKPSAYHTLANGDIALLESEVPGVVSYLLANGFDVNAIHNHFLNESPRIVYVHFSKSEGNIVQTAILLKQLMENIGNFGVSHESNVPLSVLDGDVLNGILGLKGEIKAGGVYRADLLRSFHVLDDWKLSEPEGTIAIQGTAGSALLAGEIPLKASEVPRFLKALDFNQIDVTALHNHETEEVPRVFYVHFSITGPSDQIAFAVKNALDSIKIEK